MGLLGLGFWEPRIGRILRICLGCGGLGLGFFWEPRKGRKGLGWVGFFWGGLASCYEGSVAIVDVDVVAVAA